MAAPSLIQIISVGTCHLCFTEKNFDPGTPRISMYPAPIFNSRGQPPEKQCVKINIENNIESKFPLQIVDIYFFYFDPRCGIPIVGYPAPNIYPLPLLGQKHRVHKTSARWRHQRRIFLFIFSKKPLDFCIWHPIFLEMTHYFLEMTHWFGVNNSLFFANDTPYFRNDTLTPPGSKTPSAENLR